VDNEFEEELVRMEEDIDAKIARKNSGEQSKPSTPVATEVPFSARRSVQNVSCSAYNGVVADYFRLYRASILMTTVHDVRD
jgi:hypothetical protein